MNKKHLLFLFCSFFFSSSISQEISKGDLIGKWKVIKISNYDKNEELKLKSYLEMYSKSIFEFKSNDLFNFLTDDTNTEIKNGFWYIVKNQVIVLEKKPNVNQKEERHLLAKILVEFKDSKYFFKFDHSKLIFEVVKF